MASRKSPRPQPTRPGRDAEPGAPAVDVEERARERTSGRAGSLRPPTPSPAAARDAALARLRSSIARHTPTSVAPADATPPGAPDDAGAPAAPSFRRTRNAARRDGGDMATWDRMPLPDVDQPRRRWAWLGAFARRRRPSLPAGQPAYPLPAGDRVPRPAEERAQAAGAVPEDDGPRGSDHAAAIPRTPGRPVRLPPAGGRVPFRLVDPVVVRFPAMLTLRALTLSGPYLRALNRLARPATSAIRKRGRRRRAPVLPAPAARLALPSPDPADPLRRRLPVPFVARPRSLVPAIAGRLPIAWQVLRATARRRPGARHLLATLVAALVLTAGGPLLLSSERLAERIEPAIDLLTGEPEAPPERREIVLVAPEPPAIADDLAATPADTAALPGPAVMPAPAEEGPGSWSRLYRLGHELWDAGDTDGAITALTGASELNPDHPAIAYDLGWALQRAGRGDEAIAHYRRAIELSPDHAFANYNLGFLLKERGRDSEAARLLARAVDLLPRNPYAAFDYAALLERQGSLIQAAEMYLRAKQNADDTRLASDANRRLDRIEAEIRQRRRS